MVEIPLVASYRLQLTPTFGLDEAARLVPYLARLGISHVYTSSYLQAAAGSTHGYDVVDPMAVNVELGGDAALLRFYEILGHEGLGHIIDVVPNHMAVGGAENRLWWQVLERGQDAAAARYFDIDWDPPQPKLVGKVLLPVLGGSYADELASGAIHLVRTEAGPEIHYADHRFPVNSESLAAMSNDGDLDRFGDPTALHELLERQHYRLASWAVGRHELNYRRFFEVNTLAGVRVEDEAVFAAVHRRSLEWVEQGHVQGLRVDHPDGLRDPGGYLRRLRAAAPDSWIVVEKILEPGESLPTDWPVDGTTGYDFMQTLTAVFVDPDAEAAMTQTYELITGNDEAYSVVLRRCKAYAVRELFASELTRLVQLGAGICERSVASSDVGRRTLQAALEAILVATPVYRTYVAGGPASAADAAVIAATIVAAKATEPTIDPSLFDFLAGVWGGGWAAATGGGSGVRVDPQADEFVARLQQLSGPAMAKGAEDTAFYRYHRLIALNEVGSDPSRFGIGTDEFHATMVEAAADRPLSMVATSTHDTKRSEDVRVRIALLAEIPDEWRLAVIAWREHNRINWGTAEPDHNFEYLLYQTLIGAHPLSVERTLAFATKAMREAKQHSSWLRPDEKYEAAVAGFIRAVGRDSAFQAMLTEFVGRLVRPARIAALAQALIKATAPGIPDFYQGSELWTASLVDPENRTPVDFGLRRRIAAETAGVPDIATADDLHGVAKLAVIRAALTVRRDHPDAFVGKSASYTPLRLVGERADAGVAFGRGDRVITVAPVRPVTVDRNGWGDTVVKLPAGQWTSALRADGEGAARHLTGDVSLGELTGDRSIALLVRTDAG